MADLDKIRDRLSGKLERERIHIWRHEDYYEADQPLEFLSPVLKDELDGRIKEMVFNLPRYAVEVYDHRLDIEGFRFRGNDSVDDELWSVWEENDGSFLSQQGHQEALALARSYAIVGEGDPGDAPLITVESPMQCVHEVDPRTKKVAFGMKRWQDLEELDWCTVYTPDGRTTWYANGGEWKLDSEETDNGFGVPRLVPFMNNPRLLAVDILQNLHRYRWDRRLGRPIFADIIPLVDAINKMLTDMMVSGEFHAMPRRWAVGLKDEDFNDEHGNPLKTFELIAGRIWASENKDARMGQFSETDLSVFHNTVKVLLQMAAQLLGLPPHYLTFTGTNPPSADAIRSAESQLVKRAERMQQNFSGQWETVQKLVLLTLGYPKTREMSQIETIWRDPSTPTVAQKADAITKLVATRDSSGRSIVPTLQAREDLGYTPSQRKRMLEYDAQQIEDPQISAAMRALGTAGGVTGA